MADSKEMVEDENKIGTVIGDDIEFRGTLSFKKSLKIKGFFEGKIETDGHLLVGNDPWKGVDVRDGRLLLVVPDCSILLPSPPKRFVGRRQRFAQQVLPGPDRTPRGEDFRRDPAPDDPPDLGTRRAGRGPSRSSTAAKTRRESTTCTVNWTCGRERPSPHTLRRTRPRFPP